LINADPNTNDLIYDLFKRVFISDGPFDLSVVHIRCFDDQKLPIVKPFIESDQVVYRPNATQLQLNDTDFEHLVYIDLRLTNVMVAPDFDRKAIWNDAPTEEERDLERRMKELVSEPNGTVTSNKEFIYSFAFLRPGTRNVSFLQGGKKPRLTVSTDIKPRSWLIK
jgi:hypothetical protein